MLVEKAGARRNVPRVVVIITSRSSDEVEEEAQRLRRTPNTVVLVVGIHDARQVNFVVCMCFSALHVEAKSLLL